MMTDTMETPTATADGARRPQDVTVLVVDDELDIATYLASVLEDAGMTVVMAHDGEKALEMVREHRPDLISLDLVMPGMSGIRVMQQLRRDREFSRIPVMIVTAHARDPEVRGDLDSALADSAIMGPSLYLEKPVTPMSYLDAVCRILKVEPMVDDDDRNADELKRQALDLLDSADPSTLAAIVDRLKHTR
jgi:CheY-like chemotaxis protein